MSQPSSKVYTFEDLMKNPTVLPKYQRDFAWDKDKMIQLWDDLRAHLFSEDQTKSKSDKYYLGAVVIDAVNEPEALVDGQQRFTTMTLISCAARDALIATGNVKEAHDVQSKLICKVEPGSLEYVDPIIKFQLLDTPSGGHHLSSEFRLLPYRKRITDVPTGILTKACDGNLGHISIDVEKSNKVQWSVDSAERWEFKLWDKQNQKYYDNKKFTTIEHDDNILAFNDNAPVKIHIKGKTDVNIPAGLEVVLSSNVKWCSNCKCSEKSEKTRKCDVFHRDNRQFYLHVRNDIEQLVLGEKTYSPDRGIAPTEFSTGLRLRNPGPAPLLQSASHTPSEPEATKFKEEMPILREWPSDEELLGLIKVHPETSENREVELKARLRYPIYEGKIRKRSHYMIQKCMRAIASMLNTKGGFLFIGVTDAGLIQGIHDENYDNDEDAAATLQNHIENYLGQHQEKFVDIKVITDDEGRKILVAKISRCDIPTEMYMWQLDGNGGKVKDSEVKHFFVRANLKTTSYTGTKKEQHIRTFIAPPLESTTFEHEIQAITISQAEPPAPPRLNRDTAPCPRSGCEFTGTSEELDSHQETCEYLDSDQKDPIPKDAYFSILYREAWPNWLDDVGKRVNQLRRLIYKTCFTKIKFSKDTTSAIEHFMLTNDSSRFEPLNSYDLVSAFTVKLEKTEEGVKRNKHQKRIRKLWDQVSHDLYITTEKDDKKINAFFFNWLLSTGRRERGKKRYTKDKSWNGIKREFDERTEDDGTFRYKEMEELYEEMNRFAKIYLRLADTKHHFWNEDPYDTAACRDERNLLSIIATNSSEIQHIPPLMCLVNRIETEEDADRSTVRNFLKNYNYVLLRYKTIPGLRGTSSGIKGGDIYSKMQGSENWIEDILHADMSNSSDLEMISNLPLQLEEFVTDKDQYPWSEDHDSWPTLNQWTQGKHNKENTRIRHVLFSVERALETQKSPEMHTLHATSVHAEHILAQDNKVLKDEDGIAWPNSNTFLVENPDWDHEDNDELSYEISMKYWKKHVHSLGNRCLLEDTANTAIKNLHPANKFSHPKDPRFPFNNSNYKTARMAFEIWTDRGSRHWEHYHMEELSKLYMNAIVKYFTPE